MQRQTSVDRVDRCVVARFDRWVVDCVDRWMWTDGMCVATGFTNMFSFVASVLSLCMIALNRCTRVCRPELYNAFYSSRATQLHITGDNFRFLFDWAPSTN